MSLFLTGCSSSLDYPQGWGINTQEVLENGCPDLTGSYSTQAAETSSESVGTPPLLNEILGPGNLSDINRQQGRPWPPAAPGATTGTFTSDGDDWVYVKFGEEAEGADTLRFKRKHWWGGFNYESDAMFNCYQWDQGPTLALDGSRKPSLAVPKSFYKHDTDILEFLLTQPITGVVSLVLLSKGKDGSLIVNFRTGYASFARFGNLPIGFFETTLGSIWWRYPPVEQTQ